MAEMTDQRLVRDAMTEPTETIQASHTLSAARQRMQGDTRIKSLIVLDGDRAIGMVRYNDLNREGLAGAAIADVMLPDVPIVGEHQPLAELSGVMTEYDIDRLAVVDAEGRIVGELPRAGLTLAESHASEALTTRETLSDAIANEATPVYDVKTNMTVIGSQGSKIGTVKDLMADTLTGALTHVVVHTGLLFGKDKSIPADLVDRVEGGDVHLKISKSEIDALPDVNVDA